VKENQYALVVSADAAMKAVSSKSGLKENFGNGASAFLICGTKNGTQILEKYSSIQSSELLELVVVDVGHDSDKLISENLERISKDAKDVLGLKFNNVLGLKMISMANQFYKNFFEDIDEPNYLVMHNPNAKLSQVIKKILSFSSGEFYDRISTIPNCGAATTGIILIDLMKEKVDLENKKVFICSFGTGGVISGCLIKL
jgi:3-oxoacyl-[acyl-carrier-protein] synthase III